MKNFRYLFLKSFLAIGLPLPFTFLFCSCNKEQNKNIVPEVVEPFLLSKHYSDGTTAGLLTTVCAFYQLPDSLSYYEGNQYITCYIDWKDSLSVLQIRKYLEKEGVYDSDDSDEQCLFRMRFLGFEVSPLCVFRNDSLRSVIQALHDKTPLFMRCKDNKWLVDGYDERRQLFHCLDHTGKDSLLSVSSLLEDTESSDGEAYYTVIEGGAKKQRVGITNDYK